MKNETKLLVCASLVILIALSFIATTIVDASGQETNSNAGPFRRLVGWLRQRWGRYGRVEVTEEFKANAITIAESDTDVQRLLTDGYSIITVRPIIKSLVDANGDVTSKATHAIVILKNEDAKSFATVWVDLNAARVIKIVTFTRTVIDKS